MKVLWFFLWLRWSGRHGHLMSLGFRKKTGLEPWVYERPRSEHDYLITVHFGYTHFSVAVFDNLDRVRYHFGQHKTFRDFVRVIGKTHYEAFVRFWEYEGSRKDP